MLIVSGLNERPTGRIRAPPSLGPPFLCGVYTKLGVGSGVRVEVGRFSRLPSLALFISWVKPPSPQEFSEMSFQSACRRRTNCTLGSARIAMSSSGALRCALCRGSLCMNRLTTLSH